LETAHSTVQQQQQQLQQMEAESQQAKQAANAGSEPGAEPAASTISQVNACINNLRMIEAAKQAWALENNKTAGAAPTVQDLMPYFADGVVPVCPAGGIYTINLVGVPPTCSIPGHELPQ
jgi:hypothetical protein